MMYQERIPYVAGIQRKAIAGTAFTAKFPKIDSYDYLLVKSVTVYDQTDNNATFHIGVYNGPTTFYVQSIRLAIKDFYYKLQGSMVVPRGYGVVIKCTDHVAGDVIYANVTGELVSMCESDG